MKIQEIMTKDPSCVTPDATVRDAAQVMKREDVGVVPVVDANSSKRLVGIVTDRDIAIRCVAEGKDASHLASALDITEEEASARLAALIAKMGAKSSLEAVAQACSRGLLRTEDHHSFLGGTSNVKPRSISL